MISHQSRDTVSPNLWIISRGKYVRLDLRKIGEGDGIELVREYEISDLARYMICPNPIEVKERIVGCEINYKKPLSSKIKERIKPALPKKLHVLLVDNRIGSEELRSSSKKNIPSFNARDLEWHFNKINDLLRPFDPALKKLLTLDLAAVSDIIGICEDLGGNPSRLNLQGDVRDKLHYMTNNLMKHVKAVIKRSNHSNGLFEMRGYNFKSYDPGKSFRLIKLYRDGKPKYCVLDHDNRPDFYVDSSESVHFLHLLDQLIKTNPKMHYSFNLCIKGQAKPLKLYFNKKLAIDYSRARLPQIYEEAFKNVGIVSDDRSVVTSSLNKLQLGVAFNYVPQTNSGEERLYTNIAVMHNFKALEPIKDCLPQLYSEINKRAPETDAGKFYLLDSIRGYGNEQ